MCIVHVCVYVDACLLTCVYIDMCICMYVYFWDGLEPEAVSFLLLATEDPLEVFLLRTVLKKTYAGDPLSPGALVSGCGGPWLPFRLLHQGRMMTFFFSRLGHGSLRASYWKGVTLLWGWLRDQEGRRVWGSGPPSFLVRAQVGQASQTKHRLSGQTSGFSGSTLGGDSSVHLTKGEDES